MPNIKEIEREMQNNNISDVEMAKALEMDLSTWYRRKAAPSKLQIGEIEIIVAILNLTHNRAAEIFLQ